jgi:hypothetical protein
LLGGCLYGRRAIFKNISADGRVRYLCVS